ncbi:hypothetical protein THAR02_02675, partial [Trichoderma harzianum]
MDSPSHWQHNPVPTTPREGTGERLAWASKRFRPITWHSRPSCTDGTDVWFLWHGFAV